MKPPFSLLLTAALGLLLTGQTVGLVPARAADDDANKPLWLGNPGVDIDQVRARNRERYEAAMHWEIDQNLAAYERIGKKDPRWDEAVRETIRNSSNYAADQPDSAAAWDRQKAACARALAAGCDDPLVVFLKVRTGNYSLDTSDEQLARFCTEAERTFAASSYSPLRKFYAAFRTAQTDMLTRRSAYGKVGQPQVGEQDPAASWAEGTDIRTAYQHGLTQFKTLLQDPAVPPALYYDTATNFFDVASSDPIGREEMLVPLEKFFADGDFKEQRPAVVKMFEGRFWTAYAWDARSILGTDNMSDELKVVFFGRVAKARTALEAAWDLDPTQSDVAVNLLNVAGDQSRPWSELDQWFRRAMDTKPNNHAAAMLYLHFLGPNWGGRDRLKNWERNEQRMIEFGRRCFATRDAASQMPIMLLTAHWRIATKFRHNDPGYWRDPGVWPDVQKVYEFLLKERPDVPAYRTDYAIYAWRAGDWRVAHEQFEIVGDNPDPAEYRYFNYTRQQYDDMRREAAEKAKAGQ